MCVFFFIFSRSSLCFFSFFFFFNDTATTEIYTLSLHDALPILAKRRWFGRPRGRTPRQDISPRSEEHTSELQSPDHLVCRLLLEKKNKNLLSPFLSIKNKKIRLTTKNKKIH